MKTKKCSKSKKVKFVSEFYKDSRYKDGYRCICKQCSRIWYKKYYNNHKKQIQEYREEHKEQRAKYNKKTEKMAYAIKLLKQALNLPGLDENTIQQHKKQILKINKLLAKIFIYFRKDAKNAHLVLDNMKKLLTSDTLFNLKMMYKYYQMMADFHKFLLKDENMSNYFLDQAINIKNQLNVIGVPI